MAEATDHDTLTRLTVQVEHLLTQNTELGKQGVRIETKLDSQGLTLTGLETRTQALESRPQPALSGGEAQTMLAEHREMYGFYSTFKNYMFPLLLSGPVSAIISALLTFAIIHASK